MRRCRTPAGTSMSPSIMNTRSVRACSMARLRRTLMGKSAYNRGENIGQQSLVIVVLSLSHDAYLHSSHASTLSSPPPSHPSLP